MFYEQEKKDFVTKKYQFVKQTLLEAFETTENFITNLEKKAFISLQRYIIYVTASKILRQFLLLSKTEQSKFIQLTILKLGGMNQ